MLNTMQMGSREISRGLGLNNICGEFMKKNIWINLLSVLFFLFHSCFAAGSILSDAVSGMTAGTWTEIQTIHDEDVIESDHATMPGIYDLFDNYASQMAYDPVSDAVYYIGCAHHDNQICPYNSGETVAHVCKFIKYDVATNTWSDETSDAWSGFPSCSSPHSSIAHGYDHSTVDFTRGHYYFRGTSDKITKRYNISTNTWSDLPVSPVTRYPVASGFGYFSALDKLVIVNGQHDELGLFDPKNGTWDSIIETPSLGNYHDQACDLPAHNLFIFGGGNELDDLYSIDKNKNIQLVGNPGGVSLNVQNLNGGGTIYLPDPISGDLVLLKDNGAEPDKTYSWNPTDGWSDVGITPPMGDGGIDGHAAVSLSKYGVIMLVRRSGHDVEVWLYKHASGDPPPPDTTPPGAPSDLLACATSSSQVRLSWTAAIDNVGVTNYGVERCRGADCLDFAQVGTSGSPSYSDNGLSASTTYRYKVRAYDAAGNAGSYSTIEDVTTNMDEPSSVVFPLPNTMPSIQDEQDTYDKWGWDWSGAVHPASVTDPYSGTYSISDPDIHGDTEGDDLWTYLQMEKRGGNSVYSIRADAWLRYFREDYNDCVGDQYRNLCDDINRLGCHIYGYGLLAEYDYHGDTAALDEAKAIGDRVVQLYDDSNVDCPPKTACLQYNFRGAGRHMILMSRLAEITGEQKRLDLLDKIVEIVLHSSLWNEQYGMYFHGEWQTNYMFSEIDDAYDLGYRGYSTFEVGVFAEGLWQVYRTTGNEEIRAKILSIADFIDQFGLDPQDQYAGYRAGVTPTGAPYHKGTADPNYTTSLVNLLVMAYKLTGTQHYLDRAKYFFSRGTKGVYGSVTERLAPDDEVHHFVDTLFDSSTGYIYLSRNKGELFYTYLIFENGGNPVVIDHSQPKNEIGLGDITGDDVVDLEDAITALQVSVGSASIQVDRCGDVNADSLIGLQEAIYSLQVSANQP